VVPKTVLAVLTCIVGLTFASGVAAAAPSQTDVTPTCPTSDYPPTTDGSSAEVVVTAAAFTPGGSGSLSLSGTIPNHVYSGTIYSTPIPFGPAASDGSGNVSFDFAVPADFELGEAHSVTLDCDGVLSASFQICVNEVGSLSSLESCAESGAGVVETTTTTGANGGTPRSGTAAGSLARTGLDYALLLLRIALVLIACGSLVVYVQRRRATPNRL
jgi:hypothetical protein